MADDNNNIQVAGTQGHEDEKVSVEGLKATLQKFKTDLLDAGLAGKVATSTYNTLVARVEAVEALMGDATTPDQDNIINKVREMIAFFANIAESDTLAGLLSSLETMVRAQFEYVTTLNAAPTGSTLTYTIGTTTYNFKVGDEVRVADQNAPSDNHGYIYYKLFDLVTEGNVTTAYWREVDTLYSTMGASGSNHAGGLVPDTPSTAGTTKFLREDGTWNSPVTSGVTDTDIGLIQSVINTLNKVVVTVSAVPTASTLTYTVNGVTCNFKVGDEVRVANGNDYDYYKLYNLVTEDNTTTATWIKTKVAYDYSDIGYAVNTDTVSGAVSISGATPLHVLDVSANVSSVSLSANPPAGHSCHVIFTAASAVTVEIAYDPTDRVTPDGQDISIEIPAGGYAEVDFLSANNKVYVRGV